MPDELLKIVVKTALGRLYPDWPVSDLLGLIKKPEKTIKNSLKDILKRNCPQEHRLFCERVVKEVLTAYPNGVDWERNPLLLDPMVLFGSLLGTYERVGGAYRSAQEDGAVHGVLRELAQLMVEIIMDDPKFQEKAAAKSLIGQANLLAGQANLQSVQVQMLQNQQQMFAMLSAMQQAKEPPTDPTAREKQARALAEQGKTAEALALLSAPERRDNPAQALTLIRQHISENQLHIQLLREQGLNRETIPQIKALYRESVSLAKRHKVSLYVLYDFADFLWPLHGYGEAIDLCLWLRKWYELEQVSEEERGRLSNLLGVLCAESNRMEEAEERYKEALDLYRKLAARSPEAYEPDVAGTCNNLGALLYTLHRMEEAEERFREALDLYRKLAARSPEAYEPDVAMTCNNLGNLLYTLHRMEEAEERYKEALSIRRRLAERNPEAYEPYVATTCNNLGLLLSALHRMEEAEERYKEALDLYRKLAARSPEAYELYVAMTCNNLGNLLSDLHRMEEAEERYKEALDLYRKLAARSPEAYEPDVAMTCNNLGTLLSDLHRMEEAEERFREALDIRRRLAACSPEAYEPYVAKTCFNLALFELKRDNKPESQRLFQEAQVLWERYPHLTHYAERARTVFKTYF